MPDFSVITCVSNPDVYQSCLVDSVNRVRSRHDIEIIPIINNNNLYSASNALNIGIDAAKSDNLVFVHQDVVLLDDWFDLLRKAIEQTDDDWGVIGSAGIDLKYSRNDIGAWGGAKSVDTVAVGTVYEHHDAVGNKPYWDGCKELCQIHCADECLFVLNKATGLRFDSQFNGFHFYGVDVCLQARAAAYKVYGCHLPIIHYGKYSTSFVGDKKYWVYFRYLYNKWRLRFPELLGTHMHWGVNPKYDSRELTSYIPMTISDNDGLSVSIKSMGIQKIILDSDSTKHYITDEEN